MLNFQSSVSRSRARSAVLTVIAVGALATAADVAVAQSMPPSEQPPGRSGGSPGSPSGNPLCQRLEGQLATIDRGRDAAKADQIKPYEDAPAKQQGESDHV